MLPAGMYTAIANIFGIKLQELLAKKKEPEVLLETGEGEALYFRDNGNITITINKLDANQKELLAPIIRGEVAEGRPVLTEQAKIATTEITPSLPTNNEKDILEFYRDKVSLRVEKCLEAALILRTMKKKGLEIGERKMEIARRFPDIGINICNLVNEGYFETYFKQVYDHMKTQESFESKQYQNFVESTVTEAPFTVFIDARSSDSVKKNELKRKLDKLKSYGLEKLIVHALGHENAEKGLRIIRELESEEEFTDLVKRANIEKTFSTLRVVFLLREQ